jgi:heterodisulfide reductase subunit A
MPAHAWEVEEALAEGVVLHDSWGVAAFADGTGDAGGQDALTGVMLKKCTAVFDAAGKFAPVYDETALKRLDAAAAIVAIGLGPDTAHLASYLRLNPNRTIAVDPGTLQSVGPETPYIFAAGDVASGPSSIPAACGQGRRAAWMIDRWLRGEALDTAAYDMRLLPPVDREAVIARQKAYRRMDVLSEGKRIAARPGGFDEIESGLTEDEAWAAAGRCLDCGVCSECRECVATCPANAVGMDMREACEEVRAGAVIVATGFRVFPADLKPQYGYGRFPNVITGMQMDRLLAPTRPYNAVLRPGDGKVPENIAYILCTGSRDETVGNPQCSRFCCMYSIKQNQLIMGALPLADVTVYYMDVRAFSKGYDEFYEQARAMGANFVRGRVARISEKPGGNLTVQYESTDTGKITTAEHDLVVLAVGVAPNPAAQALFESGELALDDASFVLEPSEDLDPGRTSIDGVFVAGAAAGARDIPDSILHAGAAAIQAAAYVEKVRTAS